MIVVDLRALQLAPDGASGWFERLLGAIDDAVPELVDMFLRDDQLGRSSAFDRFVDRPGIGARCRTYAEAAGTSCDVLVRHVAAPDDLATIGHRAVSWSPPLRAVRTVMVASEAPAATTALERAHLAALVAADRVLVPAGTIAGAVIAEAGVNRGRVEVVGLGALSAGAVPTERPRGASSEPALVAVLSSSAAPAADAERVLDAARELGNDVVGRVAFLVRPSDVERFGRDLAVTPCDVEVVADTDAARGARFAGASAVVVPHSRSGTAVADAIGAGAAVVAGDTGVHRELVPDAARRYPRDSAVGLAAALGRALADAPDTGRADRPQPDLSWERAAVRVARVLVAERETARTHAPAWSRLRLALVGSVPPTMGGVASHTAALAAAFGRCADVDVELYTATRGALDIEGLTIRAVSELPLRRQRGDVDAVLYCLGNDPNHRPLADMARQVPGAVLAHDVRLAGLFGPDGPSGDAGDPSWTTAPIACIAAPMLVMSQHAAQLVREVTDVEAVHVGPLPSWTVGTGDHQRDHTVPIVASMGIAHEIKRSEIFVAAVERVARDRPIDPVIVGPGGERFAGPDSPVRTTGFVTDDEFDVWLSSADLLVQLRRESNGESSGVAVQAAARGLPLIVSDIGAMAELPDAFARKVPVDITAEALADVIAEVLDDTGWRTAARSAALDYAATETVDRQARRIIDRLWAPSPALTEDP